MSLSQIGRRNMKAEVSGILGRGWTHRSDMGEDCPGNLGHWKNDGKTVEVLNIHDTIHLNLYLDGEIVTSVVADEEDTSRLKNLIEMVE